MNKRPTVLIPLIFVLLFLWGGAFSTHFAPPLVASQGHSPGQVDPGIGVDAMASGALCLSLLAGDAPSEVHRVLKSPNIDSPSSPDRGTLFGWNDAMGQWEGAGHYGYRPDTGDLSLEVDTLDGVQGIARLPYGDLGSAPSGLTPCEGLGDGQPKYEG